MKTFHPTTAQLETIATLINARASSERIAAALGISEAEFSAWGARLMAGRAFDESPTPQPPAPEAVTPQTVAERVFEGG